MRGAAADDDQVSVARGAAAAVAELVATLELVHVEDRRGDPQRLAVAEPQLGADARPDGEVGVRRAEGGELGGGQMADPDGAGRELRGDQVGEQSLHLGEVLARGEGQVQRDPLETAAAEPLRDRPQLLGGHAVPAHGRLELEHEPGVRLGVEQAGQVVGAADRVDQPLRRRALGNGVEGPPRREHEQVAGIAVRDIRQFVVGPDGEGVHAQPPGLAREPAEREAVAVALGDRHQPGRGLGEAAQVGAPALAVDRQREAHRRLM